MMDSYILMMPNRSAPAIDVKCTATLSHRGAPLAQLVVSDFDQDRWFESHQGGGVVSLSMILHLQGAPIAKLGVRRTLDSKVAGSILTWGVMLCP